MKKNVKATISFFRLLIEHTLKRMLLPLCRNFSEIAKEGTKNDAWDAIQSFSQECRKLLG